jgi:hypothetical protein
MSSRTDVRRRAKHAKPYSPYPHGISNRTAWIAIAAAAATALIIGLGIGAIVFADDTPPAASDIILTSTSEGAVDSALSSIPAEPGTTPGTGTGGSAPIDYEPIPTYGTDEERQALLFVADGLNVTGIFADPELLLATADKVCYDLERLIAQGRSPAYATRVVWNESLAELESEDLAGFATVFSLAPTYLCPESAAYASEVAYILGI